MNIEKLAQYVAATTGVVELQRPYQVLLKRKELEALIASVAAHEREECAKLCEPQSNWDDPLTAYEIAKAIRARSKE
jgi:hypothetical protein